MTERMTDTDGVRFVSGTASVDTDTAIGKDAKIGPECALTRSDIGEGAVIREGCRISSSRIGRMSTVGPAASIRGSNIPDFSVVGEGCVIEGLRASPTRPIVIGGMCRIVPSGGDPASSISVGHDGRFVGRIGTGLTIEYEDNDTIAGTASVGGLSSALVVSADGKAKVFLSNGSTRRSVEVSLNDTVDTLTGKVFVAFNGSPDKVFTHEAAVVSYAVMMVLSRTALREA